MQAFKLPQHFLFQGSRYFNVRQLIRRPSPDLDICTLPQRRPGTRPPFRPVGLGQQVRHEDGFQFVAVDVIVVLPTDVDDDRRRVIPKSLTKLIGGKLAGYPELGRRRRPVAVRQMNSPEHLSAVASRYGVLPTRCIHLVHTGGFVLVAGNKEVPLRERQANLEGP